MKNHTISGRPMIVTGPEHVSGGGGGSNSIYATDNPVTLHAHIARLERDLAAAQNMLSITLNGDRDLVEKATAPLRAELAAAKVQCEAERKGHDTTFCGYEAMRRIRDDALRELAEAKADAERYKTVLREQKPAAWISTWTTAKGVEMTRIGHSRDDARDPDGPEPIPLYPRIVAHLAGSKHKDGCAMSEGTHEACCDCDAIAGSK